VKAATSQVAPDSKPIPKGTDAIMRHRRWILPGVISLLTVCYCLQVFTPLRLNNDVIGLLSMGESASHGQGFLDEGRPTVFAPAYPALLSLMLRLGVASSGAIVGMNVLFLALGMLALRSILLESATQNEATIQSIVILSLLSFVFVKHLPLPMTDIPFFGIAMCCVAVTTHASRLKPAGTQFLQWIFLSWFLALTAIFLRRIGVALVPMLIWTLLSRAEVRARFRGIAAPTQIGVVFISLAAGTALVWGILETSTLRAFFSVVRGSDLLRLPLQIIRYRLTELGELAANIPSSKLPFRGEIVLPSIGVAALLLAAGGLIALRRKCPGRVQAPDVFVGSYVVLLFGWPYSDTRFWVPIVPLLVAYAARFCSHVLRGDLLRRVVAAYVAVFAVLGLLALGYSTRITFAGAKFPDRYGDGTLRATYCAALNSCGSSFDGRNVNAKALHLLRVYERR
jgi:hypothetical protein